MGPWRRHTIRAGFPLKSGLGGGGWQDREAHIVPPLARWAQEPCLNPGIAATTRPGAGRSVIMASPRLHAAE
jgi:hypothetical protein